MKGVLKFIGKIIMHSVIASVIAVIYNIIYSMIFGISDVQIDSPGLLYVLGNWGYFIGLTVYVLIKIIRKHNNPEEEVVLNPLYRIAFYIIIPLYISTHSASLQSIAIMTRASQGLSQVTKKTFGRTMTTIANCSLAVTMLLMLIFITLYNANYNTTYLFLIVNLIFIPFIMLMVLIVASFKGIRELNGNLQAHSDLNIQPGSQSDVSKNQQVYNDLGKYQGL